MFNKLTSAPMANNSNQVQTGKEVNKVYQTTKHELFKPLGGNRDVNKNHVNRLVKSMSEKVLFSPIIVNENMEVIDGQHRLEALTKLQKPVNFIVVNGYGLNEVQQLNMNSKNWNSDDYMNGYCDLNKKDYILYRDFKNKYGFGHSECQALLMGMIGTDKQRLFYSGDFKIKDLAAATDKAEKICMISKYYDGYKRRSFVFTMMSLLDNENFEFTQFLQKLKLQPTALMDCTNVGNYKLLIEEIYNYKSRNKVNLRY
jgi:hypothetical protein